MAEFDVVFGGYNLTAFKKCRTYACGPYLPHPYPQIISNTVGVGGDKIKEGCCGCVGI
jgi:hypothetical protein